MLLGVAVFAGVAVYKMRLRKRNDADAETFSNMWEPDGWPPVTSQYIQEGFPAPQPPFNQEAVPTQQSPFNQEAFPTERYMYI